MATANERKRRILVLKNLINNCNDAELYASKERIVAECCKRWGSARRTILEYLRELELNNEIEINKDDMWITGFIGRLEQMKLVDKEWQKESS